MTTTNNLRAFLSVKISPCILAPLLLLAAVPSLNAQVSVEYEVIARSGETAVPDGVGTFTYFDSGPSIDNDGNVVFFGGASNQGGIYTATGTCCEKVADLNTPAPNGGGQSFHWFSASGGNDIDAGRVAFTAQYPDAVTGSGVRGVYGNVGQFDSQNLVEVAVVDNQEWSGLGSPWIDGDIVALRGNRLVPSVHTTVLLWDGWTLSESFVDGGSGSIASNTEVSFSGDAVSFQRINSGNYELVSSDDQGIDTLAAVGSTSVPDGGGATFRLLSNMLVVDRNGQDAAFLGYFLSSPMRAGLYKRTDGGALQKVADVADIVPGTGPVAGGGDHLFKDFSPTGMSISNRQVAFLGSGQSGLQGLYTDVGGSLEVLVDSQSNDLIELDGVEEKIYALSMGHKSFALTPQGYMLVFRASLESGEHLIVRATINGTQGSTDQFTVYKDYSDNNSDSVSVSLSCSSGTVTNSPQWASEGTPAVFTIEGANAGTTCTATETSVAAGYTKDESDCQSRAINGSCSLVNTLVPSTDSFTVHKDYSDNNSDWVTVSLSCSSGTVINSPRSAREGTPAVFTIEGANAGATCTATETSVASGYTKDESDCQDGDQVNGSCTIVNTLDSVSSAIFWVWKDFSDDNPISVSVSLSCTSGTVTNNPQWVHEGVPVKFTIAGAAPNATCTATENSVPAGYSKDESDCQDGDALNKACIIVNTLTQGSSDSFTVYKDYSDNNADSVSVSLSCSSGTVTNSPRSAREGTPAVFTIEGATAGATCTATETSVASGYTKDESDCQSRAINGSCTLVNTLNQPSSDTFTVYKDYSDNNSDWVTVSLGCSSGTVTNSPRSAREGTPAVFTIEGANAGATCTATETSVAPGYTKDESDCQDGDPLNGSCTIVNYIDDLVYPGEIVRFDFEDGTTEGWSLSGNIVIDGILAIDQYSLRHIKGTSSERGISTVGYDNVIVTMHLAATSLKKNDVCKAEVSTNGGNSWIPVVEINSTGDNGQFRTGEVSPASADDIPDLRLRFHYTGKGKGGYCYGDEVVVMGTPN